MNTAPTHCDSGKIMLPTACSILCWPPHSQKITAPAALHLPDWLRGNEYSDPIGLMPTAWCSANNTDKHPYEWLVDNPWASKIAHAHMLIQREGRPLCFDALDLSKCFRSGHYFFNHLVRRYWWLNRLPVRCLSAAISRTCRKDYSPRATRNCGAGEGEACRL